MWGWCWVFVHPLQLHILLWVHMLMWLLLLLQVNTQQLDDQLVASFLPQQQPTPSSSSSSDEDSGVGSSNSGSNLWGGGVGSDSEGRVAPPSYGHSPEKDLNSLLVLRRGYSSEQQRGRWLLQKLDYLQLLLIKRAFTAVAQLGSHTAHSLTTAAAAALTNNSSSGSSSRRKTPRRQQQQQARRDSSSGSLPSGSQGTSVEAKPKRTPAAAAAAGGARRKATAAAATKNSKTLSSSGSFRGGWLRRLLGGSGSSRSSSSSSSSSTVSRTDSFGRPFVTNAADSRTQQADDAIQPSSSSSSSSSGHHCGNGSSDASSGSNDSCDGSSTGPSVEEGLLSMALLRHQGDWGSSGSNGTDSSSSSSSSSDDGAVLVSQQSLQQQPPQQQQQHVQQRRRRQRPSLLSRLRGRVEEGLCRAAYTLSDWGLIPRMDVVPLERFEAAFPLTEAPRLEPLYIEKATLPDILDPVLHARFPWWAPPAGGRSTAGDSSSSSSNGVAEFPDTAADGSSSSDYSRDVINDSGSSSLLRTFLQQVEIVEPTFRQLLVVYRKKPRVQRWRRLRELAGMAETAPPGRREPIQLQVNYLFSCQGSSRHLLAAWLLGPC